MTHHRPDVTRRTALQALAGSTLTAIAGCTDSETPDSTGDGNAAPKDQDTITRLSIEGPSLIVELSEDATVDQVNLIQPNGELYAKQEIAEGAHRTTFDLATSYPPGDYSVLALNGDETVVETTLAIQPDLAITDVGLYRNNPDKPWTEVYGESKTDRLKNGEAFVTVENTGSGPNAVIELVFSGDVPNPIENPRGSGLYETEQMVISPGKSVDLFSSSFPFGSESESGMGCSPDGNSGKFSVTIETSVDGKSHTRSFAVQYSGSDDMTDCKVTISGS